MAYACCRVAGDADRREEQLWNDDDKRYSGLLEEDDP